MIQENENDTHFGSIDISPLLYHDTAIYCMTILQMDRAFFQNHNYVRTKQLQN